MFRLIFVIAFLFILFCVVVLIPYDAVDPTTFGSPISGGRLHE